MLLNSLPVSKVMFVSFVHPSNALFPMPVTVYSLLLLSVTFDGIFISPLAVVLQFLTVAIFLPLTVVQLYVISPTVISVLSAANTPPLQVSWSVPYRI